MIASNRIGCGDCFTGRFGVPGIEVVHATVDGVLSHSSLQVQEDHLVKDRFLARALCRQAGGWPPLKALDAPPRRDAGALPKLPKGVSARLDLYGNFGSVW